MCRKAKSQYYNKICNEIESVDKSHNPKLYEKVKQLKPKKLRPEQGLVSSLRIQKDSAHEIHGIFSLTANQQTRFQLYQQQQQSTGGLVLNVSIGLQTKYILKTQMLHKV